jgi:thiol-disulfide isomerase/thioredoxin
MSRASFAFIGSLLASLLMVSVPSVSLADAVLAPGQPAPDLHLRSADGKAVSLAELKGKPILIDFWASWCPPCRTSIPALDGLYREFHDKGLEVFAINVDERRKDADAFLAGARYTMPIVFDSAGETPRVAGVYGMPTSFLVDRNGMIRFVHRGYSEKVLDSYRSEIAQLLAR